MSSRVLWVAMLSACAMASVFMARPAAAADAKTETVITIDGMHCASCAKLVAKKLEAVGNVASVQVDITTTKATVAPSKNKPVSAKALWEAVEAAGYKPTKLAGPAGTFDKKPKS